MVQWNRFGTVVFVAIWMSGWGFTEAEARPKRVYQVPNGTLFSCSLCHIGPGKTKTKLDFSISEETHDAVNEGDAICFSCHSDVSGGGPRNAFGQTIEKGFLSGSGFSGNVVWGTTLAKIDSDGDGFTNGEELGDPEGMWWPGDPAPGTPSLITYPGDPASKPRSQTQQLSPSGGGGGEPGAGLQADFNGDGEVDLSDFFQFAEGFGRKRGDPGFAPRLDLNNDGKVDLSDFFLFVQDFGRPTKGQAG